MNTVFIELGGNMGNRLQLINDAKALLINRYCNIITQSSIYETPPWGFSASLNFYNQIIEIETELSHNELLNELHKIENKLGRIRSKKRYESRTMDLDIIFFNSSIINEDNLTIPHPRMHLRKFVLVPMNEIAPDYVHPVLNTTIRKLMAACNDSSDLIKTDG